MQLRFSLLHLIPYLIYINHLSKDNEVANVDLGKGWMFLLTMSSLKDLLSYSQKTIEEREDTEEKQDL